MVAKRNVTEVEDLFKHRRRNYVKQKESILNKNQPLSCEFDPTIPDIWIDVWDYYDIIYTDTLSKQKIIEGLCAISDNSNKESKTAVNIAIDLDILNDIPTSNEQFFVLEPNKLPEAYLDNISEYIGYDFWRCFWEDNLFAKSTPIEENKFDQACKDYFDESNNAVEAIKEVGFVSGIIEKNNGKIQLHEVKINQDNDTPTYRDYEKPNLTDQTVDVDKDAVKQFAELIDIMSNRDKDYSISQESLISIFDKWVDINNVSLDELAVDKSQYIRQDRFEDIFTEVTDAKFGRATIKNEIKEVFYPIELTKSAESLKIFAELDSNR